MLNEKELISKDQSHRIEEALASINPLQSGVEIDYHLLTSEFWFKTPRNEVESSSIGFSGIYARSLYEMEKQAVGISSVLWNETGKIEFWGNGLSPVPWEVVNPVLANPDLTSPVIVNDRFDYRLIAADIDTIINTLQEQELPVPSYLLWYQQCAASLLLGMDSGLLMPVQHTIGEANTPAVLHDAALAINIYGPPESTLRDQLSLLAPGGKLIIATNFPIEQVPYGYALLGYMNNLYGVANTAVIQRKE